MTFKTALKAAVPTLSLAFLSACGYPSHTLGEEPGLRGTTSSEVMFDGAAPEKHLVIKGSALKSEHRYVYSRSLTIEGNVPPKTEIIVENGKLEVTGNVGSGSEIDVHLPEITHDQTDLVPMPIMVSCGQNCTTTTVIIVPVTSTIVDGLMFPSDATPAAKIGGRIGDSVKLRTNGGIEAGGWGAQFNYVTGYGRKLAQVIPPAPGCGPSAPAPR